jgi:hypothetical protein
MERRYVVLSAASKASGVDTGATAPASCPYGTSAESPLMLAGANRPLAGIVVLDFGQVYQGPYATLLMAKAGADVIKIEPPQGEPLRRRAPPGKSTTFPIAMLNSNKRAITLNLKHARSARCCSAWSSAATYCWRISHPGSWTVWASAGRYCTG